ncbi:OmpA family protein [Pulveribacter suum]|uniref:OmpA family protein n=1 Tax=Pulveribacter suum TaxID=2116657 RepID=A0A2P1NJE3_9BURK|nr:OmpA family protein [Pulveribacter suum]AVP57198.1 OmpA family protein [Pulveribacter suum]
MSERPRLQALLPWAAGLLLCTAAAAEGVPVVRSAQPLAQAATQLAPASAPATVLQPKTTPGGLTPRSDTTRLQAGQGPQTLLREAEVPPQRLAQTRALLAELKAESTPQQAISIDLPADVLFDFDKAQLRPDAAPSIAKAAELIRSYPQAPITVVGHTDAKGTDAYNDALSLRRAQAVAQALGQQAGRAAQSQGQGKRQPVAPNTTPDGRDDPQGRQLNRRVQILIGLPAGG